MTDLGREHSREAREILPNNFQSFPLLTNFVFLTNETGDVVYWQSAPIGETTNDYNNHSVMPSPVFILGLESFPGILAKEKGNKKKSLECPDHRINIFVTSRLSEQGTADLAREDK